MYSNITGGCLVAIGNKALCSNNCTSFSTAVGHETLMTAVTATSNTAVGFRALCLANANGNTAVGDSTLRNTTAGRYNESFGYHALYYNTCGCQNVGIGTHALYSNTTGNNNTAVGNNALRSNTTGALNTSVGLYAGCNNTDGNCNVNFGYAAGRFLADGSTALTSPDNSTYIGTCTRGYGDNDQNVTVLGYCACACGDNTVSIGNCDVTDNYFNGNITTTGGLSATGACCSYFGGGVDVTGHFCACSKAFLIDHPTKPGKKLKHGSIEAPEWSVQYRGNTDQDSITLPEYWDGLVRDDSVSAILTPVGEYQCLYVKHQDNKHVCVGGVSGCFNYVVYGERKDIDKMEVEIDGV